MCTCAHRRKHFTHHAFGLSSFWRRCRGESFRVDIEKVQLYITLAFLIFILFFFLQVLVIGFLCVSDVVAD